MAGLVAKDYGTFPATSTEIEACIYTKSMRIIVNAVSLSITRIRATAGLLPVRPDMLIVQPTLFGSP
jgi:hypothetical protein